MTSIQNTQQSLKRWQVAPAVPDEIIRQNPQIHPILLQLLYNRGLTSPAEIEAFLTGQYHKSTDPLLPAGMEAAVERIVAAVKAQETIVIYGDFDADGVTSTVLLTEALRALGLDRKKSTPLHPRSSGRGIWFEQRGIRKN